VVSFAVFDTTAVLLVTDPVAGDQARSIADAELAAIDLACSRFRPDSEISLLNKNAGRLTPVSELFAELIAEALRAAELTGGDVDPTVGQALVAAGYDRDFGELPGVGPSAVRQTASAVPGWRNVLLDRAGRQVRLARGAQLDLGSTAKAWAADRCADLIASQLSCGVLVSLGGDVAVAGPPPDDGWHVKATDDHAGPGDAPGQVITIREGGLATSSTTVRTWEADGKRMHHLIDPRTGSPVASPWRTVSVAAATCLDANIASTAAIIRGEPAVAWLTELTLPARLVTQSGAVTVTPGWPPPPPAGTAT
jgi:thiamine biosynthesis lipoprotein